MNYKKISQESDAFVFSDQFIPYFELEISGIYSSSKLELSKYTAGTTEDPNDYSLPNIDNLTLPNKLSRINPFNKNSSIELLLDGQVENKKVYEKDELISSEAEEFLQFLRNVNLNKNQNISLDNHIFISENTEYSLFNIHDRKYLLDIQKTDIDGFEFAESPNIKSDSITNIDNSETIINNKNYQSKFDYKTNNSNNRFETRNEFFTTDVRSEGNSYYNDFSSKVEQKQIITEMKSEILQTFQQSITNLENKIINENTTKQDIVNIENKIVQVFETKLKNVQDEIIEKIEDKSSKQLSRFKNNFLNS